MITKEKAVEILIKWKEPESVEDAKELMQAKQLGIEALKLQLFKPDRPDREKMTDWIYNSLKEIEMEEGIKLSDRAFIADHLAPKLLALIPDGELRTKIEKHFAEYEWMGIEDWKHLKEL